MSGAIPFPGGQPFLRHRHMQGIKDQIIAIVQAVRSTGCQVSGLGFIGYKDWCDGNDHIQTFPIIKADAAGLQRFQTFVQGIVPTGGGTIWRTS